MKTKRMLYSLLLAGCVCTISNVKATTLSIDKIAATSGTLNRVVTKSTSDQYWTA